MMIPNDNQIELLRQRYHELKKAQLDLDWTIDSVESMRNRYRKLEGPCYNFVSTLIEIGGGDLLAAHAQLVPEPTLRPFPYRVPRPIPIPGPVDIWSAGEQQQVDDVTAGARLLLWFAVAHNPDDFGADCLYWQQVLHSLPVYHPPGRCESRPINRIHIGVHNAAKALIDAVLADTKTITELSPVGGNRLNQIGGRQKYPTLKSIAQNLNVSYTTVWRWRKDEVLHVEEIDGNFVCAKSELDRLRKP